MRYVAYEETGDTPSIIVDGAGNSATAITLSHWPKSGTPRPLKADTSAEIVFNYLSAPEFHVEAQAVSNNHFDLDGLVGIHILLEPDAATAARDRIVDVAHAGDFATYRDRQAARIAFTVSAFTDPERSPLDAAIFAMPYPAQCAALHREMLPRIGEMLAAPDRFHEHWADEDRFLEESEAALRRGDVKIVERPEVDLAVVRVAGRPQADDPRPWTGETACHAMAIYNATDCNRILVQQGRRYALTYRYESWVQFMTRAVPPRADLVPLAEALSAEEPGAGTWRFDGVAEITPRMVLSGATESAIAPEAFVERVAAFLATAPAAWDPYDPIPGRRLPQRLGPARD